MSVWTVLWLLWAAGFVAIEGVALVNDARDDTLSEHLRRWFRTDTHLGRSVWVATTGVFFGWFIVHIAVAGSM
jgi:hypothetical protein